MGLFKRLRGKSPKPSTQSAETSRAPEAKVQPAAVPGPNASASLPVRTASTSKQPEKKLETPVKEPDEDDTATLAEPSLWQQAYSRLKADNPELVQGFEQLVQHEDSPDPSSSIVDNAAGDRATQAGVDHICATGQARMAEAETKFRIRNQEYKAHDVFAKGIKVLSWAKDLAGLATQASPEASVACAALFLVLPLFENLDKVKEANASGFTYVAASMKYYMALEPELLSIRDAISAELMEPAETSIVDLYYHVLSFQLQSAMRFNRGKFKNKFRDMFDYDGWEGMLASVKNAEGLVAQRWDAIQRTVAVRDLRGLRQETLQAFQNLQSQVEDLTVLMREQAQTTREIADTVKRMEERSLTKEENERLQVLRRNDAGGLSYEQAKDRTEERVAGTCLWLLEDEEYQIWLASKAGLLLVSADPGCGKSVLSKFLVDEALPRDATICYFFLKDEDQDTLQQALCAILHQLMCSKAFLVNEYLQPVHEKNGDSLSSNTALLWDVLRDSLVDTRTGPVFVLIDGLDECKTEEFEDLSRYINLLFDDPLINQHQVRCLMTTRPYNEITSQFESSHIRVSGEARSAMIKEEVKLVIQYKLATLKKMPSVMPAKLLPVLEQKLLSIDHPTYLWMSLTFKFIQSKGFKKTQKGLEQAIDRLPRTINEAYEKILGKTDAEEKPRVLKALTVVLGASRPLTVGEMNVVMNFETEMESMDELDLEDDEDFELSLRDLTGLFLNIHNNHVYFLHQTVREFLRSGAGVQPEGKWQGSIAPADANTLMARTCVNYLWLYNNTPELPLAVPESLQMPHMTDDERAFWGPRDRLSLDDCIARFHCTALFTYATESGISHLQDDIDDDLLAILMKLFNEPKTNLWIYWALPTPASDDHRENAIFTASYFGITGALRRLVAAPGVDLAIRNEDGCTPLYVAVSENNLGAARVLLEAGASPQPVFDGDTWDAVVEAAIYGNVAMIRLLVQHGADVNARGRGPFVDTVKSAIHTAVRQREEGAVSVLVELGADVNSTLEVGGGSFETPLHAAVAMYSADMVRHLLSLGADINARDGKGQTPLERARVSKNLRDVVEVLLQAGAGEGTQIKTYRAAALNV